MSYRTVRDAMTFRLGCGTRHRNLALHFNLLWLLALGVWTGSSSLWWVPASAANQGEQDVRPLKLGEPIQRELAGGQSHAYQIALAEDRFLNVAVEQRGIDVVVRLLGPDGKQIMQIDSELRLQGQERVSQVGEVAGSYRLIVQAKEKEAPAGRYEIRVVELRAATEKDLALQEARKLETELLRLYRAGKYDEARPLAERVLEIREKALGSDHPDVARSLSNLASLNRIKGDYARAELLHQRALAVREKTLGPEHRDVAESLHNLANLYLVKSAYAKAEPLYQRALTIYEKTLGPGHPNVATSLNSLAVLYRDKGDYARAGQLFQSALTIWEKALGPEHPHVAFPLNNLAEVYRARGNYTEAEPLYQRALAIREKTLGPHHPDVARSLDNLAIFYSVKREYAKAEPLYQRALAIWENAFGPDHPDVAQSLNNLANLYCDRDEYAKAEPLYQRALAIRENALGLEHADVATSLYNLAILCEGKGDLAQAVTFQLRTSVIRESNLAHNLATGSERQKLAYMATLSAETDRTISLHVYSAPNDSMARSLAITLILQRKGRVLDAMFDSLGSLRRRFNAQDQTLLDQLKDTNAQLARLVLSGPQRIIPAEYQKQIKALEAQKEKYEAEISRRAEFRAQSQPVTLEAVQAAIPADAAIIEFFSYRSFSSSYTKPAKAFGQRRYVAYVLRRQGEPQWVELGEAKVIDDAVAAWRKALRDPKRPDVKRLARRVDELVMRQVRALLGSTRRVFISPDGTLNLIPFAALMDERDQYLVERYSFSYLTSGRDLLRLQERLPGKPEPVIVADPAFGERAGVTLAERRDVELRPNAQVSTTQSISLNRVYFPRLPGTTGEAQALKKILPQAAILIREQATEAALKQLSSPRILHIATHGFFLEDIETKPANTRDVVLLGDGPGGLPAGPNGVQLENPLLRSGLALAGVNLRRNSSEQEDDGVLTAMEAAGLDLWGTKLVVLSACDTGVGEVKNGEGVYGLRRALVLAGSEAQVMSLWPVSDLGTRDLMIEYYKVLQRGAGRSEGLRQVQLQMLRSKNRRHPFYWASFIQSGEWANLEGKR